MGSLILNYLRCTGHSFTIETKAQDSQYSVESVFSELTVR